MLVASVRERSRGCSSKACLKKRNGVSEQVNGNRLLDGKIAVQFLEVEPRGFEPLTSAVQRRRHALLEVSRACKTAAKARIFFRTLFPSFQVIDSGCCTVAARGPYPRRGA